MKKSKGFSLTMGSMCPSVLVLTIVILFFEFLPIPAQMLSTSAPSLQQELDTQTIHSVVTELLTKPPSETTGPTHAETTSPTVPQTSVVETTAVPSPETTSAPASETTIPIQQTTTIPVLPTTAPGPPPHTTELVPTEGVSTESPTTPKMSTSGPSITTTQEKERSTKEDVSETIPAAQTTHLERTRATVTVTEPQSTVLADIYSTYVSAQTTGSHTDKTTQSWLLLTIIILVCSTCIVGVLICIGCVKTRRKKRSENFSSSLRNGGSHKGKRKKGAESDTWAGPVAFSGDWGAGAEEGGKEEHANKEADEVEVVLSTFTAKDKEDAGDHKVGQEEDSKAAEVPLMSTDKDAQEVLTLPEPIEDGGVGGDEGINFCLTSTV